jgi:hypothetical protein
MTFRLIRGALAWWTFHALHVVLPLSISPRFNFLLPWAGDWIYRKEARQQ